jgi:hypothetical protein
MLKLQSFVSDLKQRLKGRVWLLVTGQQKLEDGGDASILGKLKDRFPEKLRVHLAVTNIRDVVHKRLLAKTPAAIDALRTLFQRHRSDLRLFAYDGEAITEDDFVDVYPLLPGHIDLILQVTSALRERSSRSQGDDQAIRGLLQLLGELFRGQGLADREVGALVTLDQMYEVQHTALDADVQASMDRVLRHCASNNLALAARAAKAVALLELIQERVPTDARLVATCVYDRLDLGNNRAAVQEALEELRRANLLGYSEKLGYKLQSSTGEEWERERRDLVIPPEQRSELIAGALKQLVAEPERPRLDGQQFPWLAFSRTARVSTPARGPADPGRRHRFRYPPRPVSATPPWVDRSSDKASNRLVWVVSDRRARQRRRDSASPRRWSSATRGATSRWARSGCCSRRSRGRKSASWRCGAPWIRRGWRAVCTSAASRPSRVTSPAPRARCSGARPSGRSGICFRTSSRRASRPPRSCSSSSPS